MKTKVISMAVTDEEYNKIRKAAYENAIKNDKPLSVSAFALNIVNDHLNGNSPPSQEPYIETPAIPSLTFDDIQL